MHVILLIILMWGKAYADCGKWQPGHPLSPIPDLNEIRQQADIIWHETGKEIPGIYTHEKQQLNLLESFIPYIDTFPAFPETKQKNFRYFTSNGSYGIGDAFFLYSMMRHFKPQRIIEVGSGFSSALMLDINDRFFNNHITFTFIDPSPERLLSALTLADKEKTCIIAKQVQKVSLDVFKQLKKNDILFIDSSHVSKIGSDVNYLFFDVLPQLAPGVLVHIHDVCWGFEYPKEWVLHEQRFWSEQYLLRGLLMYNHVFRIILFSSFLFRFHKAWFNQHIPALLHNPGGCLWFQVASPHQG